MKVIYEDNVPTAINWELKGPIKVGDKLIWEPLDSDVRCLVKVVRKYIFDGETFYDLKGVDGSESVNSERTVRGSCVRDLRGCKEIPVSFVFGEGDD